MDFLFAIHFSIAGMTKVREFVCIQRTERQQHEQQIPGKASSGLGLLFTHEYISTQLLINSGDGMGLCQGKQPLERLSTRHCFSFFPSHTLLWKVMVYSWPAFSFLEQQIQFFQEAAWKFNSCSSIDNSTFLRSSGLCFPGVSQAWSNKKAQCSKVLTALNITTEGQQTFGCGKKFPTSFSDKLLFSPHRELLFLWQ